MTEIAVLSLAAAGYLVLLAIVASAGERGFIPRKIASHPVVYALGLCVFESTWGYYGNVGLGKAEGYQMIAASLGASLSCLLIPVVWMPVLRLTRKYQLSSLADLFAFRYPSSKVGVAVTVLMLAGSIPYVGQQIQGVTESVQQLGGAGSPRVIGLAFCGVIALAAMFFGYRHSEAGERHDGLAVAMAFESVVKIAGLLAAGAIALALVFHGPTGLGHWLAENPSKTTELLRPIQNGKWSTVVFAALASMFLMPRMYHVMFVAAPPEGERALAAAAWLFPLCRILLALPLPIVLLAGGVLAPGGNPDFYALRVAETPGGSVLKILVFLGGVSAASAMVIVTTLALGTMCLKHLLLPVFRPSPDRNAYAVVQWGRGAVTFAVVGAAYAFFFPLAGAKGRLVDFGGNAAFVAVAQVVPGLIGVLFWKRASARAVLAGLAGGVAAWICLSMMPVFIRSGSLPGSVDLAAFLHVAAGGRLEFAFVASLAINGLVFAAVSFSRRPTDDEQDAARACAEMAEPLPADVLVAKSPDEIEAGLEPIIGPIARLEVTRALDDLGLSREERRPLALLRLRSRLERNLTGLLGPDLAALIVKQGVRLKGVRITAAHHLKELERQVAALERVGAELDGARCHILDLLEQVPIAACAIDARGKVTAWNEAFARLTGMPERCAAPLDCEQLSPLWAALVTDFLNGEGLQRARVQVPGRAGPLLVNLMKSKRHLGGRCLVIEEVVEDPESAEQLGFRERLTAELVARSPKMKEVVENVVKFAPAESLTVMILGPTGSGKELVARALHEGSPRANKPFVVVNCAALAPTLIHSELFGHVQGAFSGADENRIGLFEAAHGGTVFLDEIGELPLEFQPVLLRVLETGEVKRLGENKLRKVDVRVVAATHRNLAHMAEGETFREDLFYRLADCRIDVPPLLERSEDFSPLVNRLLSLVDGDGHGKRLSPGALKAMRRHSWPGNVRELKSAAKRAVAKSGRSREIKASHLDLHAIRPRVHSIEEYARRTISQMEAWGCTQEEIAEALGVSRQTLHRWRKRDSGLEELN